MATYSKATTTGNYTIYLVVNNVDQDITNNRSKVQYKAYITGASGTTSWGTGSYTVSINGAQTSGSIQYDFASSKTWYCVGSASAYVTSGYITHNSDGTKSINVSFSFSGASLVGSASISETFTLNTIPRASDVSVSNYSITNTSGSLSATITSKANFYHKWRWKIGSGSFSSWTNKGLISTTSSTVTVANTSLLSGMQTSTSATFTIEVRTYSDSGYATLVGTKTATCTVSVNTSNIKPSVTLGNIALNTSPISGYAVAGYSTIKSSWSASGGYGTTSNTTYFTVSNGSLTSTSSTSASGTVTSNTIPQSASNYTLTINAYSKDSRGAVSDTVSKSITVYGYQPPTATLSAYRVADSTSTTEDGAGVYVYVTFSGAVRSTVNSQNSVQSTVCTYSGSISGTATNGQHIALADSQSATFTLTVTDKVTSSTVIVSVAPALYPLDLYDNGQGTVGVGFGTTAESGKVKSALPLEVEGNITTSGSLYANGGDVTSGYTTRRANSFIGAHSLAGKIYLYAYDKATSNKGLAVMNNAGTYQEILAIDQNNNPTIKGNLTVTGQAHIKNYITINTDVNASLANNNVSGTAYPTSMNIVDNANRIIARSEAVVNPNGNIGMNMYVRNYNTSGGQVAQKGIQFHMNKSGNLTWTVSDNANFREAIGVAYATVTATLASSASFTTLSYPSGFTVSNSVIINWAINTNTASSPAWATGHGLASGSDRTFVQQNSSNILFYNNESAYYGKTVRVVLMKIG